MTTPEELGTVGFWNFSTRTPTAYRDAAELRREVRDYYGGADVRKALDAWDGRSVAVISFYSDVGHDPGIDALVGPLRAVRAAMKDFEQTGNGDALTWARDRGWLLDV